MSNGSKLDFNNGKVDTLEKILENARQRRRLVRRADSLLVALYRESNTVPAGNAINDASASVGDAVSILRDLSAETAAAAIIAVAEALPRSLNPDDRGGMNVAQDLIAQLGGILR